MTKNEYINAMYVILSRKCAERGYHNVACGMIAQSIQEGWNSLLAKNYYNYWGMKASKDYKGKTVFMNNKSKTDPAIYRTYISMEDGCDGYFKFLEYPRYKMLKTCLSDISYLDNIGPCGWNSNIGYGDRCKSHLNDVYNALINNGVIYEIGRVYTLQSNMYIRKEPNGDKKELSEITDNAKENSYADDNGFAILKKGTRVTCKEIVTVVDKKQTWIRIPSGFICAMTKDKVYII